MNGTAERAFECRLEKVKLAHGDATGRYDDIHIAEGMAQVFFERAGSVG